MSFKLKRTEPGVYTGRAFFNHRAVVSKTVDGKAWSWVLHTQEGVVAEGTEQTKRDAEYAIRAYGRENKVTVKNLMSGKDVQLSLDQVGGPCDPSTERYWSM